MIRRRLVEQGKVTYVSFAFPLERIHSEAKRAGEAAECAARQGRCWEMREKIFADSPSLSIANLLKSASLIDLDMNRFEACLAGEAVASVAADVHQGRRLSVDSTPTFFVGKIRSDGWVELTKRIKGAATFDQIAAAISEVSAG